MDELAKAAREITIAIAALQEASAHIGETSCLDGRTVTWFRRLFNAQIKQVQSLLRYVQLEIDAVHSQAGGESHGE